jgi:hypothetical protein
MLSDDTFNAQQGAETNTTKLASAEEDHDDAAGFIRHNTFEGRIPSPGLNPHGADSAREGGWFSRLDLGDAGSVGREVQYRCVDTRPSVP